MKSEMITRFVFALASANIYTTFLEKSTALSGKIRDSLLTHGTFPVASYSKGKKPPHDLQMLSYAFSIATKTVCLDCVFINKCPMNIKDSLCF